MSDRLAIGVMTAARGAGRAVPRDISVVGFDDVGSAAHVRPALTTARQPLRPKGYAAARLLLDAPAGGRSSDGRPPDERVGPDEFDLPVEPVVRRSTRAPAACSVRPDASCRAP